MRSATLRLLGPGVTPSGGRTDALMTFESWLLLMYNAEFSVYAHNLEHETPTILTGAALDTCTIHTQVGDKTPTILTRHPYPPHSAACTPAHLSRFYCCSPVHVSSEVGALMRGLFVARFWFMLIAHLPCPDCAC